MTRQSITGCFVLICCCSRSQSRELFLELVNEYSFTVDQLLELAGFSCAVAIAKVLLRPLSIPLCPLSLPVSVLVSVPSSIVTVGH